jgi:DNA-binding Xre family transcriptional regulator
MKILGYEWRLREVMADRGMFSTTKLTPLLQERGIELSSSQVYRLAAEKPERLNLHVLVALLDILDCTSDDLIKRVDLGNAAGVATGTEGSGSTDRSAALRSGGHRPVRMVVPNAPDA